MRIETALAVAEECVSIDGAHHKAWVVDQMVRALTADGYAAWVAKVTAGPEGPDSYRWEEGTPP